MTTLLLIARISELGKQVKYTASMCEVSPSRSEKIM